MNFGQFKKFTVLLYRFEFQLCSFESPNQVTQFLIIWIVLFHLKSTKLKSAN